MASWGNLDAAPPGHTADEDWPVEDKSSASGWGSKGSGWGAAQPTQYTTQWQEQHEEAEEDADDAMLSAEEDEGMSSSSSFYVPQVSHEEYTKQMKAFTKDQVAKLVASPEYQTKITRCHLCWKVWYKGESSPDCAECGGYGMQRPCPICFGKCGAIWKRDVDMSHSHNLAHWDGDCLLPEDEMHRYLAQHMMQDGTEEDILDGMAELQTS